MGDFANCRPYLLASNRAKVHAWLLALLCLVGLCCVVCLFLCGVSPVFSHAFLIPNLLTMIMQLQIQIIIDLSFGKEMDVTHEQPLMGYI